MPLFWGILSHFGSGAGMAVFLEKISQKNYGKSFVSFLKQIENVKQFEHFGGIFLFVA